MKTTKLIYTSTENCNCNCSHDTIHAEPYKGSKLTAKFIKMCLRQYEAHEHTSQKAITLTITRENSNGDKFVSEFLLGTATWNMTHQRWDYITFRIDYSNPDNEFFDLR